MHDHHHTSPFLLAAVAALGDVVAHNTATIVSLVAVVCTLVSTGVNLLRFLDDRRERRRASGVRLYSPEGPPR